ncbi:MAG: amidohydrolase family protein [Patescibacteria group bacterium]|nr:amidohydrolase family protein [Patescibacteria group bacterium]
MTILIKNGLIYSGIEEPPVKKDILIQGKKIVYIGDFSKKKADLIIDATQKIVTPGFIDINANSDHFLSIFTEPYQEDFVKQGVTTIIGGNCGISLAPIIRGSLYFIDKWAETNVININWRSLGEFLDLLEKQKLGLNFGTLVGHSTIRRIITQGKFRDLTDKEIESSKKILEESFNEGALGLSSGLSFAHSKKVPTYEINAIAEVAALSGKVYATHLRNYENKLLESIEETLDLSKKTKANIEISHFQPVKIFSPIYKKAIEIINKESANNYINFDIHPFENSSVDLYALLPKWLQNGNLNEMEKNTMSPWLNNILLDHFIEFNDKDIIIENIVDPKFKFLEGKTITEFAENQGLKVNESILKLMQLTHLKATISLRDIDCSMLEKLIAENSSIIASSTAALDPKHSKFKKNYWSFPTFLKLIVDKKIISFEKAISKITSLPAKKYNIPKRGTIQEGYCADINILNSETPQTVIINGQIVFDNNELKKKLSGSIIRGKK